MTDESAKPTLTRRACLRLTILGAAGLSLLPGCRNAGAADSPLGKWAELGRIWREMRGYWKTPRWTDQRHAQFRRLRAQMDSALTAVRAWPELRQVFTNEADGLDEQFGMQAAFRSGITCYEVAYTPAMRAHQEVERQASVLEGLATQGKLTKEAAGKAAAVLAVQAEFLARGADADKLPGDEARAARLRLQTDYDAGKLRPGQPAALAGERLAEMTVDKLGWLAGPPKEKERAE